MNSRRHIISKVAQGSIDAMLPMHTVGLFTNPIADQAAIIDAVEVVKLTGSYKNRPGCAELMFDGIWGEIRNLPWPGAKLLRNSGHIGLKRPSPRNAWKALSKLKLRNCNPEE